MILPVNIRSGHGQESTNHSPKESPQGVVCSFKNIRSLAIPRHCDCRPCSSSRCNNNQVSADGGLQQCSWFSFETLFISTAEVVVSVAEGGRKEQLG